MKNVSDAQQHAGMRKQLLEKKEKPASGLTMQQKEVEYHVSKESGLLKLCKRVKFGSK